MKIAIDTNNVIPKPEPPIACGKKGGKSTLNCRMDSANNDEIIIKLEQPIRSIL
jgi:hypothetical protein